MKCSQLDYIEVLEDTLKTLDQQKDYITQLDATTGDGDHYINMHMGFTQVVAKKEDLLELNFSAMLLEIGKILMKSIGGSSGVLYGSGYMRASQVIGDQHDISLKDLLNIYKAILEAIQERGKTGPGEKTMVDTLYPFVHSLADGVCSGGVEKEVVREALKKAQEGMESTKNMVAVKGRATYQSNKGVGHLDPGAVTLYYHLEVLINHITEGV